MCVYAFSICATALGKRPPAPPYHTVQVTILRATTTTTTTTTTTAQITMHAFSICGTALGKRPPPLPSHSASYNITVNHHRHHLDHHSTSYNACIQYMRHCIQYMHHQCKLLWAWFSTSTLQTIACAKEYLRTVVENNDHQRKLQRVKNYTATIGVHDAASTCNLHKGMPLNFCPYPQFNGMPLCKLQVLAASCTPMVAV